MINKSKDHPMIKITSIIINNKSYTNNKQNMKKEKKKKENEKRILLLNRKLFWRTLPNQSLNHHSSYYKHPIHEELPIIWQTF